MKQRKVQRAKQHRENIEYCEHLLHPLLTLVHKSVEHRSAARETYLEEMENEEHGKGCMLQDTERFCSDEA